MIVEFMIWYYENHLEYFDDFNYYNVVIFLEYYEITKEFHNRGLDHKFAKETLSIDCVNS